MNHSPDSPTPYRASNEQPPKMGLIFSDPVPYSLTNLTVTIEMQDRDLSAMLTRLFAEQVFDQPPNQFGDDHHSPLIEKAQIDFIRDSGVAGNSVYPQTE